MTRKSNTQVNIRSAYVRERTRELAAKTGKTVTQVVEDAVRSYQPEEEILPEGMMRVGKLVVFKGHGDGRVITLEDTNRAIEADRNRNIWGDED